MKRDPDLLRDILLLVEDQPAATRVYGHQLSERFPNIPELEVADHVLQLIDAGLIEGSSRIYIDEKMCKVSIDRLTGPGHDFLSATQTSGVWEEAKKQVVEAGVAWTLTTLIAWVKFEASKIVGSD